MSASQWVAWLRVPHLGPFAIFDLATAFLGVYLVAPLLSRLTGLVGIRLARTDWLWLTLPIGLAFHLALGIDTPLTRMVLDPSGHWTAKIVIVLCLVLGLRGAFGFR